MCGGWGQYSTTSRCKSVGHCLKKGQINTSYNNTVFLFIHLTCRRCFLLITYMRPDGQSNHLFITTTAESSNLKQLPLSDLCSYFPTACHYVL